MNIIGNNWYKLIVFFVCLVGLVKILNYICRKGFLNYDFFGNLSFVKVRI